MGITRRLNGRLNVLLVLVGVVCLAAPATAAYTALNTTQVQKLQSYIEAKIDSTAVTNADGTVRRPLIPAFVRLAFHDCCSPGGCDGCVNLAIADNNGLKPAVDNLEILYNDATLGISKLLSRADFWALAGLTAANYGARLQRPPPNAPPGTLPYIPPSLVPTTAFKTGRKDCTGAPKGSETSSNFPSGLKGQTETFAFFKNFFGFTATEAVAILGAHTLGRAVVQDSGFAGPWVPADNRLDNDYYRTLSDATLGWAQATAPGTGGKIQWQRPGPPPPPGAPARPPFIMLNADMCLFKQLTLSTTGASSCTYSTCPFNANSYQTVQQYAANNTKWLDDFGAAFNKMTKICGRSTSYVLTQCTLTALKPTTVQAAAAQPEDLVAEPVPLDVSLATAQPAAAQPENAAAEVQTVPVAVEGGTVPAAVAVEGAAGMTAEAAAGVTTATAPEVPAMPGAEQEVVVPQAVPALVPDAQAGGGNRRRAARKLV